MTRLIWTASRSLTAFADVARMLILVVLTLGMEGRGVDGLSPVPNWSEQGYAWPKGTYSLPVTDAGQCPGSGYDEEEWSTGQLLQDVVREWREGGRAVEGGTGAGGKEGLEGGREEYMLTMAREQARNNFCTKTVTGDVSPFEFMPGRYCLWKKHRCPAGFEEGWVQLDSQSTVTSSGALPDGSYENLTVLMAFCCRSDGSPSAAVRLPDVRPFALLRLGRSPCQIVENMEASDGWSSWEGLPTVSDGLYPEMDVGGGDLEVVTSNRTRVFTCVYRPRRCSGRCLAVFLDVFFVCFVVGVLVLAVCLQLRKRCGKGSRGTSSSTAKLHFFYDDDTEEGDDDDEERSVGFEPLLPFYARRRCALSRDAGQLMRGGDSMAPATVMVTRLPSQTSTDDDVDDDDDEDEDDDEEDIAWDVAVFVQLPQQPARHLGTGRTDDARGVAAGGRSSEGAAGERNSPPPPYEETAAGEVEAPPGSVGDEDGTQPMQEPMKEQQLQQ